MITLTKAREMARQATRSYFDAGRVQYVYCPSCRARVESETVAWAKRPAQLRALREALVEHLRDEERCAA